MKRLRWQAKWIGNPRESDEDAQPAIYFRKRFFLPAPPRKAEIYITACGIFEASINGERVGKDVLTPGWPDYYRRANYLSYDVTSQLEAGHNAICVSLAEGWYAGYLSEPQFRLRYGRDPMLLAQLSIRDSMGKRIIIGTDESWETGTGPITSASLYHGESFDARRPIRFRSKAGLMQTPKIEICEKICPPVQCIEERRAISVSRRPDGAWIYDFGEDIAGWVRLFVRAKRGTRVILRHGEMLDSDGSLYTANLRTARATDEYIAKGSGTEVWEPRFTYHGFRFVELRGLTGDPDLTTLTGIVIQSALEDAGSFTCSDPLLNQLQRCIVRGQRGNFIDVPTDCPQRDERLGWAGDTQIFCKTALYNQHAAPLFRQWMQAMRDGQRRDGAFPDIAPHIILEHGNAGWSDAGIIVPWTVWKLTGDPTILGENYSAMQAHLSWIKRRSPDGIRRDAMFGDWLAPDAAKPELSPTPREFIGTAYFARLAEYMAEVAEALRRHDDAESYRKLHHGVRRVFVREFVTADGRVSGDTQTGYAMALGFGLLRRQTRSPAIGHFVEAVRRKRWHLSTGFLGTPLLCPVLARCGRADIAWRVLMQRSCPGWLFPVMHGATTMWERWDSWTPEKGFGDHKMNSFNHYAYGAIGEFLYESVAGLGQTANSVGFRRLRVAPQPGGGVTSASAVHRTPQGEARVAWTVKRRRFEMEATVPDGCSAEILLPGELRPRLTKAGTHSFSTNLP